MSNEDYKLEIEAPGYFEAETSNEFIVVSNKIALIQCFTVLLLFDAA